MIKSEITEATESASTKPSAYSRVLKVKSKFGLVSAIVLNVELILVLYSADIRELFFSITKLEDAKIPKVLIVGVTSMFWRICCWVWLIFLFFMRFLLKLLMINYSCNNYTSFRNVVRVVRLSESKCSKKIHVSAIAAPFNNEVKDDNVDWLPQNTVLYGILTNSESSPTISEPKS